MYPASFRDESSQQQRRPPPALNTLFDRKNLCECNSIHACVKYVHRLLYAPKPLLNLETRSFDFEKFDLLVAEESYCAVESQSHRHHK
jgi:hypothetical protein